MNIDELIRESIDESTAGRVPPPDLAAMRRDGRRRSVVRVGGATLAALAVVAAGVGVVQQVGGIDDATPASLPARSSTAYLSSTSDAEVLHWSNRDLAPEHAKPDSTQMPAMTRAGLVYLGYDGTPYLIDKSGEETALGDPVDSPPGERDGWAMVASDTRGDYAAWAHYARGRVTISRFDAGSRKVTTSDTFACAAIASGCDHATAQVVDRGIVYVTAAVGGGARDSTIAWDPSRPDGERLYPLTDPGTSLATAGRNQLVLAGPGKAYGGPDRAPLPGSTNVSRLGKDESRDATVTHMSPDGRWRIVDPQRFMMPHRNGDIPVRVALNVVTGRTVTLNVSDVDDATFDDDGSLLVIVRTDDGQRMDDCTIPSGGCETVIEHLDGESAVFPDGGIV